MSLKLSKNLVLFVSTFIFSFLAAECYLRWNPPVQVYMATRNIVQLTHSQPSSNPLISYMPRPGLEKPFRNREFNTTVKINSRGMRDKEYALEKPAGVKRIAVMGDSFVFGWGVENEEIFTEILENQYLKNTEVLNFGVSGYAAYQELERLKRDALKFKPDVVLFFLYGIPEAYQGEGAPYFEEPPSFKRKIIQFLEKYSYFFVLLQEARGVIQVTEPPVEALSSGEPEIDIEKGWEILTELKRMGLEHKFEPIAVYIPLKQSIWKGEDPDVLAVSTQCAGLGVRFFDLTEPLRNFMGRENKSPYFRIDDHWNKEGHRAVAKALSEFLPK